MFNSFLSTTYWFCFCSQLISPADRRLWIPLPDSYSDVLSKQFLQSHLPRAGAFTAPLLGRKQICLCIFNKLRKCVSVIHNWLPVIVKLYYRLENSLNRTDFKIILNTCRTELNKCSIDQSNTSLHHYIVVSEHKQI